MTEDSQAGLFGAADLAPVAPPEPVISIYVHFETPEDVAEFGRLIGQPVTTQTRWLAFPPEELFPDRSLGALAATKPEDVS